MRRPPEDRVDLIGPGQSTLAVQRAIHRAEGFLGSRHVITVYESDDFKVARQFPVGDVPPELTLFPLTAGCEMLYELVPETGTRGARCLQSLGRFPKRARQGELGRELEVIGIAFDHGLGLALVFFSSLSCVVGGCL